MASSDPLSPLVSPLCSFGGGCCHPRHTPLCLPVAVPTPGHSWDRSCPGGNVLLYLLVDLGRHLVCVAGSGKITQRFHPDSAKLFLSCFCLLKQQCRLAKAVMFYS